MYVYVCILIMDCMNSEQEGATPLMICAKYGDLNSARRLIDAGCDTLLEHKDVRNFN